MPDLARYWRSLRSGPLGVASALVLELVLFSILSPFFFTSENLTNITLQASINAIIAAGITFVILTGGIDLSVGALVAVVGIVAATVGGGITDPVLGVTLVLGTGLLVGALSGGIAGWCITRFSVTPFIATLALMTILRGLAFLLTNGQPVWEIPAWFSEPGSGRIAGFPIPTLVMILVYALSHAVLTRTPFGRHVLAVGGNREAAHVAGVRTRRVLLSVYLLSGVLTALSGILMASRMNSGQPNAGLMYELDAIAAVAVGGASLAGGRGTIIGTLLGALLIAVLHNGLNLLNISSYLQQVIVGFVILAAAMLDRVRSSSTL